MDANAAALFSCTAESLLGLDADARWAPANAHRGPEMTQGSVRFIGIVLAAVFSILPLAAGAAAQRSTQGKADVTNTVADLKFVAAIVLPDMTVRPLPLLTLELTGIGDTTESKSVRTDLAGSAEVSLRVGQWRLRSAQPVTVADSSYRWDIQIDVTSDIKSLELTNANAIATQATKTMARQIAPEREVFERVRRGVFRIEGGLGHGSGFLIGDLGGLIVTNDHVVANSPTATVYLDSATRVPAQVVSRDRDADLAVLRISSSRLEGRPWLPLSRVSDGQELVVAGERVLAIGFPLNQEMTLTTGIVSSVRDGAIISDVNINHGNSGGPMLNLAGEVVGVNAFGDFTDQGGPGLSGAIAVTRLASMLKRAESELARLPMVEDRVLPTMPRDVYELPLINAIADSVAPTAYKNLTARNAGAFKVTITTPVMMRALKLKAAREVTADRRKREERAGVTSDERYVELGVERDWERYVGALTSPVVAVTIEPQLGETFWSALGRTLEASQYGRSLSAAKMKFKGDVRGVRFYRNGVEVEPLRGGHGPQPVLVDNQWVEMKDVADYGYYLLPPEAFAPDSAGVPARLFVAIQDLKNPKVMSAIEFSGAQTARVWNDFTWYYRGRGKPFVSADPKAKASKIQMACDPTSGTCAAGKPRGYHDAMFF